MRGIYRKIIFSLFASIFLSTAVFAKDIAVQIVQHGGNKDTVSETALVFEDKILNSLFDSGHIVTNFPAAISLSDDEDTELRQKLFSDFAVAGGEYAIQVIILINSNATTENFKLADISKVEWNVTIIKTGKEKVGQVEGPSGVKKGVDDSIQAYASTVASKIIKSL